MCYGSSGKLIYINFIKSNSNVSNKGGISKCDRHSDTCMSFLSLAFRTLEAVKLTWPISQNLAVAESHSPGFRVWSLQRASLS